MISIHLFRQKKDVVEPFNLNVNEEVQKRFIKNGNKNMMDLIGQLKVC